MISVKNIPHSDQEYPTVGNWHLRGVGEDRTDIFVEVSQMNNEDYEFLVSIHEQIEAYACYKSGITEQEVTAFDEAYEQGRAEGDTSEAGDSTSAPYKDAHFLATTIERILAQALGVDWNEYEKVVSSL
jgi:hypothetical protein